MFHCDPSNVITWLEDKRVAVARSFSKRRQLDIPHLIRVDMLAQSLRIGPFVWGQAQLKSLNHFSIARKASHYVVHVVKEPASLTNLKELVQVARVDPRLRLLKVILLATVHAVLVQILRC